MKIVVMNGPNMNLLGQRETHIYGGRTLAQIEDSLKALGNELGVSVSCFQSNREGELVDALQQADTDSDGIILNAAAYTHTSVAITRCHVAAIKIPVVEVHLSNPLARDDFRKTSLIAGVCVQAPYPDSGSSPTRWPFSGLRGRDD